MKGWTAVESLSVIRVFFFFSSRRRHTRCSRDWSSDVCSSDLHSLFGDAGKSVLRGGFAITNDYYGQALAVDWDLNNTLGFTSNYTTPANKIGRASCRERV